jgi:hypothetical protein
MPCERPLQSSQSPQNLVHAPEGGALIASGFTARVGRAGGARTSGLVSSGRTLVECRRVAFGNHKPNSCPLNGAEGKCLCKWSTPMRLSLRSQISGASRRRLARWLVGSPIKDSSAISSWKRLRKQTATAPLQRACLGSPTCCVIRLRNIQRTALMCHHPAARRRLSSRAAKQDFLLFKGRARLRLRPTKRHSLHRRRSQLTPRQDVTQSPPK